MSEKDPDVIDRLVGIDEGLRASTPNSRRSVQQARANAQKSYERAV